MHRRANLAEQRIRRLVVKVGSQVLTAPGGLNLEVIAALARQIEEILGRGTQVILVSSGAVASGVRKIGLPGRPEELPRRQAAAAVGQAGLIMEYEKAFERYHRLVAQILLTSEDLSSRKRYLNARNTLNTLLEWGIVPVVNENDTVSVEEIRLGDNDNLAAMITLLMDADLLIVLSDIDGLYDQDPRRNPAARLIPEVTAGHRQIEKVAGELPGELGTGGMRSKLSAARKVNTAGVPFVLARGTEENVLIRILAGDPLGTYFAPRAGRLARRKCWIAFSLKPRGNLALDAGAVNALVRQGKSLLASGITAVQGEFAVGAPVTLTGPGGEEIGVGLVNYSAADIRRILGLHSRHIRQVLGEKPYDEVIHRDNLAVLAGGETEP
ncbi:MAG: glutamate 5-kinase [Desulfobacterales bacterium]